MTSQLGVHNATTAESLEAAKPAEFSQRYTGFALGLPQAFVVDLRRAIAERAAPAIAPV
jgi:hypothetical protein